MEMAKTGKFAFYATWHKTHFSPGYKRLKAGNIPVLKDGTKIANWFIIGAIKILGGFLDFGETTLLVPKCP